MGMQIKIFIVGLVSAFILASCSEQKLQRPPDLHPFVGCWESDNQLSREGWTIDPSGWLIGYGLTRNNSGDVVFFEHLRIEVDKNPEILVVTGQDGSQTAFVREDVGQDNIFRFINADHDFPQVIVYEVSSGRFDAYITDLAATQRVDFKKEKCR